MTSWQVCRPHPLEGRKRASLRTGEGPGLSPSNEECFSGGIAPGFWDGRRPRGWPGSPLRSLGGLLSQVT